MQPPDQSSEAHKGSRAYLQEGLSVEHAGQAASPWELTTEDEELAELKRAAYENITSHHSLKCVLGSHEFEEKVHVIDLRTLGSRSSGKDRQLVVDYALETRDQDNDRFLNKVRRRMDRVGLHFPKVEVRFENLSLEADVFVGSRSLPTLPNSVLNVVEGALQYLKLTQSHKRRFDILEDVSGCLKPGRLTLLLGPPGSGKSSLLKALAGKVQRQSGVRGSGRVTYNGETFDTFVAQRTAAYVDQTDNSIADLTVQETLDFAARCQGVGYRSEMFEKLELLEKEQGISPDPEIRAFFKASNLLGKRHSIMTEYILRLLGLEVCKDTLVGDAMHRGISGGQKKRVTLGEMMVGPKTALFLDEVSTGLDSSTTYLIIKCIRNFCHLQEATVLTALLQPAPETLDLFDDIMLLSEGHIVYHGKREGVMPFFNSMGFQKPERKGIADFLQEVTSRKDQAQYWADQSKPYSFVPVQKFVEAFQQSEVGRANAEHLCSPCMQPSSDAPDPLIRTRYALTGWQAFKACQRREWSLMLRHGWLYGFRTFQVAVVSLGIGTLFFRTILHQNTTDDGVTYLAMFFFAIVHMMFNGYSEMSIITSTLPGFYKQRDNLFYQAWASQLPVSILRLPYSFVEATVLSSLVYWLVGLAPSAGRFFIFWVYMFLVHQMAVAIFRLMGAIGRSLVIATVLGNLSLLLLVVLGGFVLDKRDVHPWVIWAFWISPVMFAQEGMSLNEMTAPRWRKSVPSPSGSTTLGDAVLTSRGQFTSTFYIWLGALVLLAYNVLFNALLMLAMTYLRPLGASGATLPEEALNERELNRSGQTLMDVDDAADKRTSRRSIDTMPEAVDIEMGVEHQAQGDSKRSLGSNSNPGSKRQIKGVAEGQRGMVLPFVPMYLTFSNINYFVAIPAGMDQSVGVKPSGSHKPMLQLLKGVTGAFQPKILTALVGVSGAGKTTLMDVLAGRKTGGIIEGDMRLNGFPKEQATFARISGYCEQADVHSPQVTVGESLKFSAQLRLQGVDSHTLLQFVEEVMELVELDPLRHALVGLPGQSGLSVEARKRLTIAVELVANPSIVFMDEPTSGLDARAAAIVMRTVRNVVNTGRTIVCTIHQPSIDIFEAFDDLLLLKRGGQVIYCGPLGAKSVHLIDYFQSIQNVPCLAEGLNPATWMLEISTIGMEERIGVDFAEVFANSSLSRQNEELIEKLSVTVEGTVPLSFPDEFPTSMPRQTQLLMQKMFISYWRNPQYNTVRYVFSIALGLITGAVYWRAGAKMGTENDVLNVMGAIFVAQIFMGTSNSSTIQPVVAIERTVFNRERAAGLYAVLPYALAQGLVEIPYIIVQAAVYSLITYWMIYFEVSAAKFWWYFLVEVLTLLYFTNYGFMTVTLSPTVQMAAVFSSAFFSLWFLFGGFLQPEPTTPDWWKWFYYIDPISWTLYSVVVNQLGDVDTTLVDSNGNVTTVAEFIRNRFGYRHEWEAWTILVLIAFWLTFWAAAGVALKHLNWQKR